MAKKKSGGLKIKGSLVKLMAGAALLAVIYGVANPQAVPDPTLQAQAQIWHDQWFAQNFALPSPPPIVQAISERFASFATKVKLPKQVTGMQEDMTVNQVVDQLKAKVQDLPAEQVQQIKQNFCADVVQQTASVAGAESGQ